VSSYRQCVKLVHRDSGLSGFIPSMGSVSSNRQWAKWVHTVSGLSSYRQWAKFIPSVGLVHNVSGLSELYTIIGLSSYRQWAKFIPSVA
jgi:hypothetical protein